jgi:hypothetical protein
LQKYTDKVEKSDNPLMLDVDEYLNLLNNEETMFDKNPYSSIDSDTDSRAESTVNNKNPSGSLGNQAKIGTSASSKGTSLFGKGKKGMTDFMKNQLSKTKQSGNDAVFTIRKLLDFNG